MLSYYYNILKISIQGGFLMKKLTAIVVGFGSRSNTYTYYAESHPEELKAEDLLKSLVQKAK